ncbi:MAG: TfoX/Sxy family protein [Actinobacteria bacterium]|nr:TfoX/Sxy family protein [Actinomycetota bacterium]
MAYDERLAERVRAILAEREDLSERKMFGGIAFMLAGNMAVGVSGDDLIVRLDPEEYEAALDEPGAREFDMTGRPMTGWLLVGPDATAAEDGLRSWVERAAAFASSLPPK